MEPSQSLTYRLMVRTGRYYHLVTIILVQLIITYPGLAAGALAIQYNARFTEEQFSRSAIASALLVTLGNILVLMGAFLSSRDAMTRMAQWQAGKPMATGQAELRAWQQITSLAWRYGAAAILVSVFIDIIPLLIYQYVYLNVTQDQLIYTAFGGIVSAIFIITTAVLSIEFLLRPARELLLPASFDMQLVGTVGLRIRQKFVIIVLALIVFSILLIAPMGYKQTYTAIFEEIGSLQALYELQVGSILVSVVALISGAALAFILSQSISSPVNDLIQVFNRVEKGEIKERARVSSTDETGELAIYFNRMISRLEELQQNLEKRVEEQTQKLRASNEVGRIASTILDPDALVTRVVNLIAKSFDYYYVAIFLVVDNGRWAEIKDATGSVGEILKSRRQRLQVGGSSIVGTAISSSEPQVATDAGESAVRFNNPLLPNTRSELALPLTVGERVIGALDVQSTRAEDFQAEDISTLQNVAAQVAIAIENARLFKEMDQALEELRQANSQYILSAWSDRLKTSALEYSVKSPSGSTSEDVKDIQVQLNLRDQNIGQIRLQTEGEWTLEDQAWVESLATQVAISLENARLIEESQQSALRERLSASIVQKLWSSSSIDGILQTAARELGRTLEASETTIELKVED
jgi:GAF domain-containing protein/HAMP domain-containing protein